MFLRALLFIVLFATLPFKAHASEPLSPAQQCLFELSKLSSDIQVEQALNPTELIKSVNRISVNGDQASYALTTDSGRLYYIVVRFGYVPHPSLPGQAIPVAQVVSVKQGTR